jgi:hypothetical protein
MRIELSDGKVLELRDDEAQSLYATLLGRTRRGAMSAALKLRPAIAWSSGAQTTVALDQFETEAVQAACADEQLGT